MPTVTINDRTVDVEVGTNLVDAAAKVGIDIPHYCYHPRLSVVGQCRMCLVQIEGMPKLQAGCSTPVTRDGMVVRTESDDVQQAQKAVMALLLINHPLDCPVCDQAGECGLQDYSFEHGVSFSRFEYEDKRTYPGRERIPLGPQVVLNMNRCIQCTRCVRFTQEVSETGELGFFDRGARAEIGVFPGRQLDHHLAGNVVDLCPVGALTSSDFRFAERVWNLDKRSSLCTGCDLGCNITLEHRGSSIKRYKPRFNPAVNDHWLCDFGRTSHHRYRERPRLEAPRVRRDGKIRHTDWSSALDELFVQLRSRGGEDASMALISSGHLTTEEAFLLVQLARLCETPHRGIWAQPSEPWWIPNLSGRITAGDAAPNRRGAELVGLIPEDDGRAPADLVDGSWAELPSMILVADAQLGQAAHDPEVVARLRQTDYLVVLGWEDSPLAEVADVALPTATHAEREGTFVNRYGRLQRFERAFPPPGQARPLLAILGNLLGRHDRSWRDLRAADVFALATEETNALAGLSYEAIPPTGIEIHVDPSARS